MTRARLAVALLAIATAAAALERDDVLRLLREGEALCESWDFTAAQERGEAALRLARSRPDRALEARSLALLGNVADSRGDHDAASGLHGAALRIAREIRDGPLEGAVLADRCLASWRRAEYGGALALCEEAASIQERHGDTAGLASTLDLVGRIRFKKGEYGAASESYAQSLRLHEKAGDRAGQAVVLEDAADLRFERGEYATAIETWERALRLRERLDDVPGQAWLHKAIGVGWMRQGALGKAEERFVRALDLASRASDRAGRATALQHLGRLSIRQGRYERAIECLDEAVDLHRAMGDRRSTAWDLEILGAAHVARGDDTAALTAYQLARALREEIRDERALAGTLHRIAQVHERRGDLDAALDGYGKELALCERIDLAFTSVALSALGRVHAARGNAELALSFGRRAVEHAERIGNADLACPAHHALGVIQRRLGRNEEALRSFRTSMDLVERLRSNLSPSDETKTGFLEGKQEIYSDAISLLVDMGRGDEALEVAERARARAFLDLLGGRELQAKPADAATLSRIRPVVAPTASTAGGMRGGDELSAELDRLRRERPELASLVSVPPPDLSVLRGEARRRGATILELHSAASRLTAWVMLPDGTIRSVSTPAAREDLAALAADLRNPGDRASAAARKLHELVVAPVEAWLPADPDALVIVVPHGPLFRVSFAGLLDEDGRAFLEKHTVAYSPAMSVLPYTRAKRGLVAPGVAHALVVGNPAMPAVPGRSQPLAPLPGAEAEAGKVGALYAPGRVTLLTGTRATERTVRDLAPAQAVLHFATHGILVDDEPLESLLALAPSPPADGLLTAREIFQLDLHADLVVLSACDTGMGRITGDGVIGMSRAFLYAGTPSVVVSLWRVADAVAGFEMERFHRERKQGRGKAQALRRAQLATLAALRSGSLRSPAGKALPPDPAYWAPFVLIGEAD